MIESLSTIIGRVESTDDVDTQAELLKRYSSAALKIIIGYAMDPKVQWLIPQGKVPYRPLSKNADQEGGLYREAPRLFQYFVNGSVGREVKQIKREQLFIQMLESIDPEDAKLVLRVRDKKLKIKLEAVKKAFPKLTATWK